MAKMTMIAVKITTTTIEMTTTNTIEITITAAIETLPPPPLKIDRHRR